MGATVRLFSLPSPGSPLGGSRAQKSQQMLQMELWTQTSAGALPALFRFIFSSDKHRQACIASESLILLLGESVARADCDLLDVDSLGHTAGFSASLGQEEPEDTLVDQRRQTVLHIWFT